MRYAQDWLDVLWTLLKRAEENGAPAACAGLMEVPFEIRADWFRSEYARKVTGWYKTGPGDVVVPFGDLGIVIAHLSDPATLLKRHHLSCAAIDIPAVPNGALSIWYRLPQGRVWTALPGVTYRAE